jgi:hypothetical protein
MKITDSNGKETYWHGKILMDMHNMNLHAPPYIEGITFTSWVLARTDVLSLSHIRGYLNKTLIVLEHDVAAASYDGMFFILATFEYEDGYSHLICDEEGDEQ